MSKIVGMHEAKTQLSRLVQELRDGQEREIIIAVPGKPCARLVPYEAPKKRVLGIDRGLITIAADFDALFLPSRLRSLGFRALSMSLTHTLAIAGLPAIHADSTDRMMMAQASIEKMTLVTRDARMLRYPVKTLLA